MGKIIISENVCLDGAVQDPTGDEGLEHGGWFARISAKDREELARAQLDEARRAEALLLGRRSYEFFAARWPSRQGELADRLNHMPKYVVTSAPGELGWNNSTVLAGDVAEEAATLRQKLDGDIVVYASFQLVHLLIEHDLFDGLRLLVFPFVPGAGQRLFTSSVAAPLRLTSARAVGANLALLAYERGQSAR